jgi:predicted nucleic acid-binding protein
MGVAIPALRALRNRGSKHIGLTAQIDGKVIHRKPLLLARFRKTPSNALKPSEVAERLREATEAVFHQFWSEGPSLLAPGLVNWEYIVGSRQVTDAYLLALAVHHEGRLVTFDHAIARRVVPGAEERHLVVL